MHDAHLRPAGKRVTRFGKELRHPEYDYVPLEPRFSASLEEGRWVGLKQRRRLSDREIEPPLCWQKHPDSLTAKCAM